MKEHDNSQRALSLRSPWAELVISGRKRIENRSWQTQYRGRIWIHESGPGGRGLLGTITLVDILTEDEAWEAFPKQRRYIEGPWCWVLADPKLRKRPILCPGALRLWRVPEHIVRPPAR